MPSELDETTFTIKTAPDPLIGAVIDGRYQVDAVLGDGGMGIVYAARHIKLGRGIAIKVLKRGLVSSGAAAKRFEREAFAAIRLNHHHIVATLDYGTLPSGSPYIAMEQLGGETLDHLLESSGPMDPSRALEIACQLCEALHAAHEIGIVHRDLKPENIQIVEQGERRDFVKVLDFGIAKVSGVTQLTATGHIIGTPHYMSPEQCRGDEVDLRADIYSIGVILYELFTGRLPFEGQLAVVIGHHLSTEPRPPSTYVSIPLRVEELILKCMRKDPRQRFETATELASELTKALEELPSWNPVTIHERATQKLDAGASPLRETGRGSVGVGPSRILLAALSVVAALVVGIGLWLGIRDEDGVREPGAGPAVAREATPPEESEPEVAEIVAPESSLAPAVAERIRVETDPPGATLRHDGVLIGNTPASFPRPQRVVEVELSLRGHRPAIVRLGPDSEADVHVVLSPVAQETGRRRGPRARGGRAVVDQPPVASQPEATEAPAPRRPRSDERGLLAPSGW